MSRRAKLERGLCALCGRDVAVRVPRGGDGTMTVPVYHTTMRDGIVRRCPGTGFEALPPQAQSNPEGA